MSIATEIQRLQTAKADIKTAIENKGVEVGNGTIDTYAEKIGEISSGGGDYEQGYEDGSLPLTQINSLNNVFSNSIFPENYDCVLHIKKVVGMQYAFYGSNVNSITLTAEQAGSTMITHGFRNCPNLQFVDFKDYKATITDISYAFYYSSKLKSIYGALDISGCPNTNATFDRCTLLEDIEFVPSTIKASISFNTSPLLSNESKESIFNGLATVETAQTLSLHANTKILQSQVDSANAKGWTVAGGTVVSEEEYYA